MHRSLCFNTSYHLAFIQLKPIIRLTKNGITSIISEQMYLQVHFISLFCIGESEKISSPTSRSPTFLEALITCLWRCAKDKEPFTFREHSWFHFVTRAWHLEFTRCSGEFVTALTSPEQLEWDPGVNTKMRLSWGETRKGVLAGLSRGVPWLTEERYRCNRVRRDKTD